MQILMILLWILSTTMIALGLVLGLCQWLAMIQVTRQGKGYSFVPLLAGLMGSVGCLISPSPAMKTMWWLPLFVDPGCVLLFSVAAADSCAALFRRIFTR